MKIEAIVTATAQLTLGLNVEENDPCNGGVAIGTQLFVDGFARIHGTDIANWDDTNVWEHTFIPRQSIAYGEPLVSDTPI